MQYSLFFSSVALFEIQDAYSWYEGKKQGLGEDFLAELESAFEKLRNNPQFFGFAIDHIRDVRLKRFPYLIVFEVNDKVVHIYSIKNIKRE